MTNTVTNARLIAGTRSVIQYVVVDSDGSEETDLVLYDSSAVATAIGRPDPLKCTLVSIKYLASVVDATNGKLELQWDAGTDVLLMPLIINQVVDLDFSKFGGLPYQGGATPTGDIALTTLGLSAGDNIFIILEVRPD